MFTLSSFKFHLHLRILLLQSGTQCSCKTFLDYVSILMRDVYLSAVFQRDYINLSIMHMQGLFIFKHPSPRLHLIYFHCLNCLVIRMMYHNTVISDKQTAASKRLAVGSNATGLIQCVPDTV